MKRATLLALALGWLPLTAVSQTPDGAVDGDTVRSAVERIETSRTTGDSPGLTQTDSDAVNRLRAGGVQSPDLSAIGNAAQAPPEYSSPRETLYERPATNEVRREPADAAPAAASDDSRPSDQADSGTDTGNNSADRNGAATTDTKDTADSGQNTTQNDPNDPAADPANADPQAGTDPASGVAPAPGHLRRVPRSRMAVYRDPRIETLGDDSDEPPRPLTPSAGFEKVQKSAAAAALALPAKSVQSFESADFATPKPGFGKVDIRTAAAEALPRIGGGFELADRRPPKRIAPRLPDKLATP